jgi:hypothetical protein
MDDTDTEPVPGQQPTRSKRGISLFRAKDAPGLFESGTMSAPVFDAADQEALKADGPRSPNIMLGGHDAVLFRGEGDDGFSLVAEGSLVMGSQVLEAGDGFFVASGAPYAYEAGPDGVVVLEFRMRTSFRMDIPGGQLERLRRMGAVADEQAEQWAELRAQVGG